LADKRSKPDPSRRTSRFRQHLALGGALWAIAGYGEAFFSGGEPDFADRRNELLDLLGHFFPASAFAFWQSRDAPAEENRRWAERLALLEALTALIERQLHRQLHSGGVVPDPLPLFRALYRQKLLDAMPDDNVDSPWRLLDDDQLERVAADAARYRSLPDPSEESDGPEVGAEARRRVEDITRWRSSRMRLISQRLRGKERQAVNMAVEAIQAGFRWHSRGRSPLKDFLSPAQMTALKRACRRDEELRPFLQELEARADALQPWLGALLGRGAPKRTRGGDYFLRYARLAEQAGRPEIGKGLRALDRAIWAGRIDEQWPTIAKALSWLHGEGLFLAASHPPRGGRRPQRGAVRGGPRQLAAAFARESLRLAVATWPTGIPPSSTSGEGDEAETDGSG